MARRDADHPTRKRARRRGPGRVALALPVLLVAGLVGGAVAADEYRWGPTHLGWKGGDPGKDPAAVALPGGLDLPRVEEPDEVAEAAPVTPLDPDAVRRALAPRLGDDDLGPHVVAAVAALDGTEPVFARGKDPLLPASTTKLLTAVAALRTLGPGATFDTTVVEGGLGEIVLVGGGDPLLASEPDPDAWPVRADLRTLAERTADGLRQRGLARVKLSYDASLFTGPAVNPHWEPSYVPDQVVSPITALWADSGHDPSGWGRVEDPARAAAVVFAKALRRAGVKVTGVAPGTAPERAEEVADVTSPPVDQIVQRLLDVSDNETTEVMLRHVGRVALGEASSAAGTRAVGEVLSNLAVDLTGWKQYDGSGLSRDNRFAARTLVDVLRIASSPDNPDLRAVVEGLPVAGFTGSLTSRFDDQRDGLGRVRAKTGTLTGVHALAGIVTGADGVPMIFVVAADKVSPAKSLDARSALDGAAAALASCSCGVGSGS
ncbi:D-alanyl-D-alanine carboxypeptidase/D-alanyl-D-alanine-endopeptidase [Nocardioides daphniae]|uniref:D-alanyl-D-alanine carboxypeptidase n=1 Tax=Nocardioides daphniae TaxID=402297 RepID=A0ABQ1Q4P8_9ACTN|nr:D-alanyl-D-alanine carboxypeptidase/D-alanyl-D-alanine-endopeptidase [Nocardioides daphniae]GGD13803.1 D-alanyl-D-alanine carboxypeptidase [Nocardioides daphniae]